MSTRRVALPVLFFVAALVLAPSAQAAMTVTIDCGASPGAEISVPGSYVLAAAVNGCGSDVAIEITATDVTLDLRGFRIDGDDDGSSGIKVSSNRVTVKNGSISNFDTGVELAGNRSRASGLTVSSSDLDGIVASGTANVVSGNTLTDNAFTGITTDTGNTIRGNEVVGRFGAGADVGILAFGTQNKIASNRVSAASIAGIFMNTGGDENTIVNNVVTGNLGSGIDSDLANDQVITGNRSTGNGGHGIFFDTGNKLRENVARGNSASGLFTSVGTGNKVIENKAHGNGGDGIRVTNDVTTRVSRNTTNGNGDLGIEAGLAVRGGNNKARGNVDADQCSPTTLCP